MEYDKTQKQEFCLFASRKPFITSATHLADLLLRTHESAVLNLDQFGGGGLK